jgi:hypothetical protein
MKVTRCGIVAATVLAGAAIGFASAASADDFSGTYTYAAGNSYTSTWTVTPCGPGCAHIESKLSHTDAHLTNGQWVLSQHYDPPNGVRCDDGVDVGATKTSTIDASTLRGTTMAQADSHCHDNTTIAFTLTKVS